MNYGYGMVNARRSESTTVNSFVVNTIIPEGREKKKTLIFSIGTLSNLDL